MTSGTISFTTPAGTVSAAFDGDRKAPALVLLAQGAGGDLDSPFMRAVAMGLGGYGLEVCRFNFAYTDAGKKRPDPQAVLEETYRAVVDEVRGSYLAGRPLIVGGKSMGGRIASNVVASGVSAHGLVFLGYPLHPPGRPERIRAAHLQDITCPMLFVEGTRDPFCPLDTLEKVRADLQATTEVAVIEDGDHSFKVRRSSGRSTEDAWAEVVDAVAAWIDAYALGRGPSSL